MRITITSFLVFVAFTALSQNVSRTQPGANAPVVTNGNTEQPAIQRAVQSQIKETPYLGYDVNQPYMGRKAEFLGNLTVSELPADFPQYDKAWSLKDYNGVVDAWYMLHMDILRPRVKAKIETLKNRQ
jgi:hypothetical protein